MKRVRIGFLIPHYPRGSTSYMPIVVRTLESAGVAVEAIHPANRAIDLGTLRVEYDLYVLREMSGLALSLAGALHSQGAAIVNPYPVSAALRDKVIRSHILQAAGVPTPIAYAASHPDELAPLLDEGPLIVKPYQGGGGHYVTVVRNRAELAQVRHGREPVFAQRYHPPNGPDRKIYAIGEQLFGVKKVFPRRTEQEQLGEPFSLTPELRDIAQRCGRAFGIDLYGVDIIESAGQPFVVDMDSMPGYKGVPDAPQLLAQYFYAAAQRAAQGEPAVVGVM